MTDAVAQGARPKVSADSGSTLSTIKNLWPYLWPADRRDLKTRVVLAMVALVAAKATSTFVPFLYKMAVDALSGEGLTATNLIVALPILLAIAYGLGQIVEQTFMQLRDALFASVGQHAVRQLAYRTFVHIHRLSLRFHLQRRTGGLSRVIERGIKGIETIVRFTILSTVPTIIEFTVVGAIFAFYFDVRYLAVLAVTVCAYVWFTVRASNWRIGIRREMNESDTDANSKAIDSLLNFETVKYFNNEQMEAARYDRSMAGYESAAIRTWTSLAWLNCGQSVIFWSGMIFCMVMAASGVLSGQLTVGDFVLVNAFLMQLYRPLNFIGFVYREIRQGLADIENMFELLDVPGEITDRPGAGPVTITDGCVRFENVRFHYDSDRPILHDVSFEVPAGKTIAIVGPSGAGKSTVSRLLYRFYDVTGGRIVIDDQDVREVTQDSLRTSIGMVPQDTVLFNDTIAYNIRYGRPSATDEEVEEAARLAQISDFIEGLPQGFDTEVGERGLKLSGGEKQRVAIARTILKAPPILVLDEATSALDTHTEREIQAALDLVSQNRTTLVIAHRLSTVINADEIIVLDAGRIVERGHHQALLDEGGLYASMWERQREVDEARDRIRRTFEADERGFLSPNTDEPDRQPLTRPNMSTF